MPTVESPYYHFTVQVQIKKFHMLNMSGCIATATVIASIVEQHNKGIEIIERPHAYIIAWKYHLELLDLNKNLYLVSRHGSLSYILTVLKSDN